MSEHFFEYKIEEYQNTKHFVSLKYFTAGLTQKDVNKKDLKPYFVSQSTNIAVTSVFVYAKDIKSISENIHFDFDNLKVYFNKKVFKITDPYIAKKKDVYKGY